jgi:MFS family permease
LGLGTHDSFLSSIFVILSIVDRVIFFTVSAAQASAKSFGGLLACRIMLGVVEAPFFPGAIMLMSSWYTRRELAHRIAWFYSGNALANMFGGLLAAGILGNLNGVHGISGWRWLFIIEGVITTAVALTSTYVLTNFPTLNRVLKYVDSSYPISQNLQSG